MKNILFVALVLILSSSCQKDLVENDFQPVEIDQVESTEVHLCTAHDNSALREDHSRAFGLKTDFWDKDTLSVRFLDGSAYVQSKVKQYAVLWSETTSIVFDFVEFGDTDIRISFTPGGSWSYIGTYNRNIPQNEKTMNFGWFNENTSEEDFKGTTLHEFGHALGLKHEHQHPEVAIPWNKEKVYEYYKRSNGWDRAKVDHNLFTRFDKGLTNYSAYDRLSIMHYFIPNSITMGDFMVPFNSELSPTDKNFMAERYPVDQDNHCEDFQGITGYLVEDDIWNVWGDNALPGYVNANYSNRQMLISRHNGHATDMLYKMGQRTSGIYELDFDLYVPRGRNAYFNLQKYADQPGREFGLEMQFSKNGVVRLYAGKYYWNSYFTPGQTTGVKMVFDLDQAIVKVYVNRRLMVRIPLNWTNRGFNGSATIGAIDFFSLNNATFYYIDNICFKKLDRPGNQGRAATDDTTGEKFDQKDFAGLRQ